MMYRGVTFDLDGTLIDSLEDIADSLNAVLEKNGFPLHDYSAYAQFIGDGMSMLIRRALPVEQRAAERIEDLLVELRREYQVRYLDKTKPFPGMTETLRVLSERGMKFAVLSNKFDDMTQKIVGELFPDISFDALIGTSETMPRKPDPTGARRIIQRMSVQPGEVIYLGDSGVDMQVAVRVGMFPVGALWGYRSEAELTAQGARRLIHRAPELIDIVEEESEG
ncbi:MAG: HAD family hydrolase [Peptococcaceae bacterium]|jgi:phosphoglycolate phosphatase|nr:HAD family hydrolase [Peptococcaceae bacterium]